MQQAPLLQSTKRSGKRPLAATLSQPWAQYGLLGACVTLLLILVVTQMPGSTSGPHAPLRRQLMPRGGVQQGQRMQEPPFAVGGTDLLAGGDLLGPESAAAAPLAAAAAAPAAAGGKAAASQPAAAAAAPAPALFPQQQQQQQPLGALPASTWQRDPSTLEIWARPLPPPGGKRQEALRQLVGPDGVKALTSLCGRALYHTLTSSVRVKGDGDFVYVATGDIPAMWIRDSAVQIGVYLPRIKKRPALRRIVEGVLRQQAFYILQDPYANAYSAAYRKSGRLDKHERLLGRGGWVFTRNYEADSPAYFFNLLSNYANTDGVWGPEHTLRDPLIYDAVMTLLQLLEVEADHEAKSPYRYIELPREGKGKEHKANTGLLWSGFRPSDDPQVYPLNIPDNIYLAGALKRLRALNRGVWRCATVEQLAAKLQAGVERGLKELALQPPPGGGETIYAYEVDGNGGVLAGFDDPNVPSLLAMPLLGAAYDEAAYARTRAYILSPRNQWYFSGSVIRGEGSPHTAHGRVWPLAVAVQALTSQEDKEAAEMLNMLHSAVAKGGPRNGLVPESIEVNGNGFTRTVFEWANAMTVVAVEQLLGVDCDAAAEADRQRLLMEREDKDKGYRPDNGGPDAAGYYVTLEADIEHVDSVH